MRAFELTEGKNTPSIVVDVQPAYVQDMTNGGSIGSHKWAAKLMQFLNNQRGPILMFVNAEQDQLTDDTVQDVQIFWEDMGFDEENWSRVQIVDKGFGYFRAWMDLGTSDATIIKVIRLMYKNRINDSRELFGGEDSDDYEINMKALIGDEMLWHSLLGDPLIVEWTSVAQLKKFSGAYIMGGGRNECLREVELLMNAFNIRYKEINEFIFG